MTRVVEQDIFRLEVTIGPFLETCRQVNKNRVPIYNIEPMEMFQCTEQLGSIETGSILIKLSLALQVVE